MTTTPAPPLPCLQVNTSLVHLNLSDNYLGEKGGVALGEALAKNSSIKEIFLKGNELGDEGIQAVCKALQVCVCGGGGGKA